MEILQQFRLYLLTLTPVLSPNSVKNYTADIRNFIRWFERLYKKEFDVTLLSPEIIRRYADGIDQKDIVNQDNLSHKTIKRHISSLRKFFVFLVERRILQSNPFDEILSQEHNDRKEDFWHLNEFKKNLYLKGLSKLTVKNYLCDIRAFTTFIEESLKHDNSYITNGNKRYQYITYSTIEEFRKRLLSVLHQSDRSINRKLSSIRNFISFLKENYNISEDNINISNNIYSDLPLDQVAKYYDEEIESVSSSKNLLLKSLKTYERFESKLVETIIYLITRSKKLSLKPELREEKNALKIQNIRKEFYAPQAISAKHFSFFKKLLYYISYSRPNWYKSYHSYPITSKVHLAILLTITSFSALLLYNNIFEKQQSKPTVLGSSTIPGSLPFQGQITDAKNNPIVDESDIRFSIYTSQDASGSALVWQELQHITPDENGKISAILGSSNPIPKDVLTGNVPLFLGITVGTGDELQPRSRIANASFASNSELLSGMTPITKSNSSSNVILALDSSGNLVINGNQTTTFESVSSNFRLSGKTLTLTTNNGSSSNIELSPDGYGQVDIQKEIVNTSSNGIITPGGVEIHDRLGIIATESAAAVLVVNNDSKSGDIITASSSGITRFVIDSSGNVGIGTQNPIFKADINGDLRVSGSTTLNTLSYTWPKEQSNGYVLTTDGAGTLSWAKPSSLTSLWEEKDGNILTNNTNSLFIGGGTLESSKFAFIINGITTPTASISGNLTLNGRSSIETTNKQDLMIGGSSTGTIILQPSGTSSTGRVQIGSDIASPVPDLLVLDKSSSSLDPQGINGAIYYNSVNNKFRCFQDGIWKDCLSSGADLSEVYYSKDDSLKPGYTVSIDGRLESGVKQTKSAYDPTILGIVSTKPGLIIGDEKKEGFPVFVALYGRVPVIVDPDSEAIKAGDFVTSGKTGYAMKAKHAGYIIGKALENWDKNSTKTVLSVFVERGFYDPLLEISEKGDISYDNKVVNLPLASSTSSQNNKVIKNTFISFLARLSLTENDLKDYLSNLLRNTKYQMQDTNIISPLASIDNIRTNIISPLSEDSEIALKFDNQQLSILNSQFSTSSAVAVIDANGNASFSGNLTAENASISGNLSVNTLEANSIQGLDKKVNNITDQIVSNRLRETKDEIDKSNTDFIQKLKSLSSSITNTYIDISTLSADFGIFKEGFVSLGTTTLREATIMDTMSIGPALKISSNSINLIGEDLAIQPLSQGGISFLSGLVHIDTDGNLNVSGNADFQKDLRVKGNLAANIISPLSNQDLTISLENSSNNKDLNTEEKNNPEFIIKNSTGSSVLTINQIGDLIASGAASISKLNFNLIAKATAISDTEAFATSSAGTAILKANKTELTLNNPNVSDSSLIYITPTSDTYGSVLYLSRQTANKSFTVGINTIIPKDVPFNWIIVN